MSRNRIEPLPEIPEAEPTLDNIADPSVSAALALDQPSPAANLQDTQVMLDSQVREQEQSLQELQQRQRLIEQKQADALREDELAQRQRLQNLFTQVEQQMNALRVLQEQQEQVLQVLSIQEKVAEQEKQLRAFNEYQNAFLRTMQSPLQAHSTGVSTLQANQQYLLSTLGSLNMGPRPVPIKGGLLDYSIPSGSVPAIAERAAQARIQDEAGSKTARFTNQPPRLGGLRPYPNQDPDQDAKMMRKAMKGLGTNEKMLLTIVGSRTNHQRILTAQAYCTNYKRDLYKDVKSETSGNFRNLLLALLMPPERFLALAVNQAIKGLGTDDASLMETLCPRTNEEMVLMKQEYQTMFGRDMVGDIKSDTSGSYQKLLMSLAASDRDESNHVDLDLAKDDALRLYNAGEEKVGTDEGVFIEVLTQRNFAQLRATFEAYSKLDDYDIEKSIARETSGKFKKALLLIVKAARSQPDLFAELLHQAMKGAGARHGSLIRVVVSRSEIDIKDISKAFASKYKHTLEQVVRSETSGDYRKLLMELLYCEQGFDPEIEAKRMFKAMKGWGAQKSTLNKIISGRNASQRQLIRETYDSMYKRVLTKDLQSELKGHHKDLVLALMMPKAEFVAREVRHAIEGLGTDDSALIEIICSRSATEMEELKEAYSELFSRDLLADVKADTSGDYQRLLSALVQAERDDLEPIDDAKAMDEAARLYAAGEGKLGTDEATFIEVLTTHSWGQLQAIFEQYDKVCDYDIAKSIKRETSSNFKKALLTVVKVVKDPCEYYADRLEKAMKGLGTNERQLTRVVVTREEVDLKEINDAFFQKYKRSLDMAIHAETSRHYRQLLQRIFDHARRTVGQRPVRPGGVHVVSSHSMVQTIPAPRGEMSRKLLMQARGQDGGGADKGYLTLGTDGDGARNRKDSTAQGYVQIGESPL
eukprot:m.9728 g.9728  ORF g.9728 m.9728 type:complete len:928 (-) comp3586_c0_seq2:255-3038(-)